MTSPTLWYTFLSLEEWYIASVVANLILMFTRLTILRQIIFHHWMNVFVFAYLGFGLMCVACRWHCKTIVTKGWSVYLFVCLYIHVHQCLSVYVSLTMYIRVPKIIEIWSIIPRRSNSRDVIDPVLPRDWPRTQHDLDKWFFLYFMHIIP